MQRKREVAKMHHFEFRPTADAAEALQVDPFDNEAAAREFEIRAWLSVAGGAVALLAIGFGLGVACAVWRGWA